MMDKLKVMSLLILLTLLSTDFSFSQARNSKPFNLDFNREILIIGAGSVAAVTAYAIMENIKPLTPEEIGLLDPSNVNSFDRGAIGPYTEDHAGDVLLYTAYLLPISFLTYGETKNDFLDLALIYGEVLLIQASINGIVKGSVQRTRPFVYDDETLIEKKTSTDARTSFFSGHTSMTAAISFFTAKVFTEYVDDKTAKILIWSGAVILPAAVAISRMNTNWHFPTDVMAGYVIGALVGHFIPELHKTKVNEDISIYPSINLNKPTLNVQLKF
jgi:membrane-associated phospholipid phosphatase